MGTLDSLNTPKVVVFHFLHFGLLQVLLAVLAL